MNGARLLFGCSGATGASSTFRSGTVLASASVASSYLFFSVVYKAPRASRLRRRRVSSVVRTECCAAAAPCSVAVSQVILAPLQLRNQSTYQPRDRLRLELSHFLLEVPHGRVIVSVRALSVSQCRLLRRQLAELVLQVEWRVALTVGSDQSALLRASLLNCR